MTTYQQHFEGQANGVAVTVANSTTYGDAAASRVDATNGTVAYSTADFMHGSRSVALSMTAAATSCTMDIGLGGVNSAGLAARAYMKLASRPSVPIRIMQLRSTAGADLGGINFYTNGTIAATDITGAVLGQSSATTQVIDPTVWYRFESVWGISATTGFYKTSVYIGDSTSAWFSYTSPATMNTGTANIGEVRFGKASNTGTIGNPWFIDDLGLSDPASTFMGAYAASGPSVATTVTPGYAKIDATGSRPAGTGALSYSLTPTTGVLQPSPGIFYVPQAATSSVYALTVAESGAGSTTRNVTVPALTAAASSQTTVMTQRYIGGSWQ